MEVEITPSSGNVFADMGMPNAEEMLFKADLAIAIDRVVRKSRLSQSAAAALAGIAQPKMSLILSGDLRGFSVERLIKVLLRLGQDVQIRIRRSKRPKGRVRVAA